MAKTARTALRIWGIFILIFGLIFASIGGIFTISSIGFTQRAIATTGIVTDIQILQPTRAAGNNSGPTFKPTIRYFDQNGAAQSGQTYLSSTGYNFELGTKLGILYDPALPRNIRMNDWFNIWGFGSAILFIGGLVMSLGWVMIRRAGRNKPYQPKTASITDESLAARKTADAKKQAANRYSSNDEPTSPTVRRK